MLNLRGLRLIEAGGARLIAAVGVAVLGAFLVLERRREFAILQTLGAGTRQILTIPALESGTVMLGSLVFGIPISLGLGMLAVRVLGLVLRAEAAAADPAAWRARRPRGGGDRGLGHRHRAVARVGQLHPSRRDPAGPLAGPRKPNAPPDPNPR